MPLDPPRVLLRLIRAALGWAESVILEAGDDPATR
jgi:hypothetical protein